MTKDNQILEMYGDFCRFLHDAESNEFYSFFSKSLQNNTAAISVFEKYVERRIDMHWIEAIENAIVSIDTIIRNPNSFIKREENIIPIAQARDVGPESIRHLAQHTNMISSVENGNVTPNKILNITKDDSLETYENRFIYTLLKNCEYFLDKRMSVLMKDTKIADLFEYQIEGSGNIGVDRVEYRFKMHMETPHEKIDEHVQLINADVHSMNPLQRIERLRKILYTFEGSAFCRALSGTPPVRSPLVLTNVLRKNPNFIKAVTLWNFINSYQELGYSTEYVEQYRNPSTEDRNEMFAIVMLEYVMMKKQCKKVGNESFSDVEELKKTTSDLEQSVPNIVTRSIEALCGQFNFTIDEVRRVFEKELKKKEKINESEFAKARSVFGRVISFEKENDRLSEIRRRERIEKEIKLVLQLAMQSAEELEQIEREEKKKRAKEEKNLYFASSNLTSTYRYSFSSKLILEQSPMQDYYDEIKNHLLSYADVNCSMAWQHERFYLGRRTLAEISCRGKTLCLTLSMDPMQFVDAKYYVEAITEKGYSTPNATRIRVKSKRGLKYANELIDILMRSLDIDKYDKPHVDYHMPYQTVDELLKADPPLIRYVNGKGNQKISQVENSSIGLMDEIQGGQLVDENDAETKNEMMSSFMNLSEDLAKDFTEEPIQNKQIENVEILIKEDAIKSGIEKLREIEFGNDTTSLLKAKRSYKGVSRKKKKKMQKDDGVFEQYRRKNQRKV